MDVTVLEKRANSIPSMNTHVARDLLRTLAKTAPDNTSIVEMGTWLGAGTAQLSLGVGERAHPIPIHTYDRFFASEGEARKAVEQGLEIEPNSDTLPEVKRLLEGFPAELHLHKSDLFDVRWENGPIGLYVDDAAKSPSAFYHVLETFAPHWVPGKTVVVLQDFGYWKKLQEGRSKMRSKVQHNFISENHSCFKRLYEKELGPSSAAVFQYEHPVSLGAIRFSNVFRRAARRFRSSIQTCRL